MADPSRSAAGGVERPSRLAFRVAATYFVLCALYIAISTFIASRVAESVDHLVGIEIWKGTLFVLLSAALIYMLMRRLLVRIARDRHLIDEQQSAMALAERRGLAGVLSSTVAHDMNNILAVGVASADLLATSGDLTADQKELIQQINESFTRMTEMTKRLAELSRTSTRVPVESGDLARVVSSEVAFLQHHDRLHRRAVSYAGPESMTAVIAIPMIQQAVVNLLLNAAEACPAGGRIEVRLRREGDDAVIEVHDNGPGVPEDKRDRIFDPSYTTKANGVGLGLLSVKAAARAHKGKVEVLDSPLGGACFRIRFPLNI